MNKLYLFLAVTMCLSLVSGLDVSAEYDSGIIVRGVDNSVDLKLTVTDAEDGLYNVYTLADVALKPSESFFISNETFEKEFTITPLKDLDVEGYYVFSYVLNYRGVEKVEKTFNLNMLSLGDVLEVGSDSIDPESGEVSFYVKNKENIELKNLSASFSSVLFDIEEVFDLGPNEEIKFDVDVEGNLLKKTKAGVYVIKAVFDTDTGEEKVDGNLFLGEKKGISSVHDESGFLIKTETITKVNVGNVLEDVEIKLRRNIVSRLFTTFNVEPTITDRNGFFVDYTWIEDNLKPTGVYVVKARTNYVFPFLTLILIVIVMFGLKRFGQTKIEVKKSVSHVKTKNGEFALRVSLALKAKKNVENVSLVDKIPAIVKIYNKFGTVKPDKIDPKSRRLHWHIGDLNAGEERSFSYVVYSKVGVVGKFSLPEALVVFEKGDKIHEIESNKVFFMSDQVRE
jgi:hypothetical protein